MALDHADSDGVCGARIVAVRWAVEVAAAAAGWRQHDGQDLCRTCTEHRTQAAGTAGGEG